jgi:hypothetical protein
MDSFVFISFTHFYDLVEHKFTLDLPDMKKRSNAASSETPRKVWPSFTGWLLDADERTAADANTFADDFGIKRSRLVRILFTAASTHC